MRIWEIGKHLEQANNIRRILEDNDSQVNKIQRPQACDNCGNRIGKPGRPCRKCHNGTIKAMKLYLFERRIERLRLLEKQAKKILEQDLKRYIKSG